MADQDLARRAVACKHWAWCEGMLSTDGARMTDDGLPEYGTTDVGSCGVAVTVAELRKVAK